MKVKSLEIRRQESYQDNPNQFVGIVELVGDGGKQSIRLSNKSISAIFKIISADAAEQARANAAATSRAISDAAEEPLLAEHTVPALGGE